MSNPQYEQDRGAGAGGGVAQQPMATPPMSPQAGYAPYAGTMAMRWGARRQYPIETKPFFLTSEFLAFAIATIALLITAAVDNSVDARFFWIIEAILIGLYMLSRGLAKAGTKSRSADPREDLLNRDDRGTRATVG